jgi:HD-GYP domain-containing protein (c-di-GMP phosphodiesterase class II)
MRATTGRLFVVILMAQTGCLAVGLGFHHLYVSSALVQAAEDDARKGLARQLTFVAAGLGQHDLSSLRQDRPLWESAVARWRTHAASTDHLYLLDPQGRVVEAAAYDATVSSVMRPAEPLALTRRSADWGWFDQPIHGVLKNPGSDDQIALADSLGSRSGYLLLTRVPDADTIHPATVQTALWEAGGITLLWTIALQAATLFMIVTQYKQDISREGTNPEVEALKQAQTLVRTQDAVIFGLAKLAESRDADTGSHLERIAHYSAALAAGLRQRPEFREQITPAFVQLIGISSALHDIGKVGLEDSILRKPGKLTPAERAQMQCHAKIGEDCLKEIERRLGSSNFLQMAREISSAHHEKWNGQGYPLGLAGEQIPLSARIVALADVYDALSRKRVYKEALPHEQCVAMIADEAGTHFDPRIVEVFLQIQDRFRQISQQFQATTKSPTTQAANRETPAVASSTIEQFLTESDFVAAAIKDYDGP